MVYCVQARLAFSTANRRNNVLNAIVTRVNGKPRWGAEVERAEAAVVREGNNGLILEMRFISEADQEDLATRMGELFPGNPPLTGSWMRLHDCTHDEATNDCVVTSTQTW